MASPRHTARLVTRVSLATALGVLLVIGVSAPAAADPTDVPDAGARPAPAGTVPLPDGSSAGVPSPPESGPGPLAGEIAEVEAEIAVAVDRLRTLEAELLPAQHTREDAEEAWRAAEAERVAAEEALADLVEEAYRGAAAVLPQLNGPRLRDLAAHAPLPVDAPLGGEAAGRKLLRAEEAAAQAERGYRAAFEAEQTLIGQVRERESELESLQDRLEQLRDRNVAVLEQEEAAEQRRVAEESYPLQTTAAGLQAHDRAVQAVEFALAQLGKPYQWGAEGPARYDCSGLMWDAYRSVGEQLPRVARDQYQGTRTRPVARHALLPGDLIFFSRSATDWRQVHHVGMYVGNGRMVHAPNRNEVVKVSPIWWSSFFAATRVIDAVPASGTRPSPTPTAPTAPPTTTPPTAPPTTAPPTTAPPTATPTVEPPTTVPDVRGMSEDEAITRLEESGLAPVPGEPITEGCDQPGEVVEQSPAPDSEVSEGAEVVYRLCAPPVIPEDVLGMSESSARDLIGQLGVTVDLRFMPADDGDPGVVVAVDPRAGTPLAGVDRVVLTVAGDGVPDVRGEDAGTATAILDQEGFRPTFVDPAGDAYEPDPDQADQVVVIEQYWHEPPQEGTTVTLVVDPGGQGGGEFANVAVETVAARFALLALGWITVWI